MLKYNIIITNYRRPTNIPRIINACLACERVHLIFLIDNSLNDQLETEHSRLLKCVNYIKMPFNSGAGYRFDFAYDQAFQGTLCLDDDIFLNPEQIDALIAHSILDPDRLHGIWGQKIEYRSDGLWLQGGIRNIEAELDILNRVYCFQRSVVEDAKALANDLGLLDWSRLGPFDDILMSMGSRLRPRCHSLGSITECQTSNDADIAVWRTKNFHKLRTDLVKRILARRAQ
ncbi:MAG: glycosyltransferase [Beijerinckiaceae bacterium]